MDLQTTKTRLRRTFAYPNDDTDDNDIDGEGEGGGEPPLDEQEQEELIATLKRQNDSRNAQFRLFLLAIPLVSTVPYLLAPVLSRGGSGPGIGMGTVLLSFSSLASTAWTLWTLPPGVTGINVLDAWVAGPSSSSSSMSTGARQRRSLGIESGGTSPLQRYLPFLNILLCTILVITGVLSRNKEGFVGLHNLPAIVYTVVLISKSLMGSVDPERELTGLRYGYKGA